MAGSAYPHIIFAKNDETLPKEELENLLRELFSGHEPAPVVDHGVLEVSIIVDDYSFTFWYDDEAEGLGARYADYAPSLKQRRVSRATTMIDFSGAPDPNGAHAETARTILQTIAERSDVYVFSEQGKRFLGMDYDDPFAATPASAPVPAQQGTTIDSEEITVHDPSSTGPKAGPDPHAPHSSQEHAENVNAAPTDPDGTPEDAPAVPDQVLAEPTMEQPAAAPQFEPVGLPVPAEEPAEDTAEEPAAEESKDPDTVGASATSDQEETAEEDTKWWKPATWFGRRK